MLVKQPECGFHYLSYVKSTGFGVNPANNTDFCEHAVATVLFHRHSDIEASTLVFPFVEYWILLSDVTASFRCADRREEGKATKPDHVFAFSQPPRHSLMSYDRSVYRCARPTAKASWKCRSCRD
jgi:hypothetical protein